MSLKIITIDGPTASGKTTVSQIVADNLGYSWVSTGVFYRSLAYISQKIDLEDKLLEQKLVGLVNDSWQVIMKKDKTALILNGEDVTHNLSTEEIGTRASIISVLPGVRAALLPRQRELTKKAVNGLIAEGRDCGTVVFPEALLKFYLTARDSARLNRRFSENEGFAKFQLERDERDSKRKHSPLSQAPGSIIIDTTKISLNEVVESVIGHIKKYVQ